MNEPWAKTNTGRFPRVEVDSPAQVDPPQPTTLPEFPDANGITGLMRVVSEGVDDARQRDDTNSSPDTPAQNRAQQ
jgi:hypothetical protein